MFQLELEKSLFTLKAAPTCKPLLQFAPHIRNLAQSRTVKPLLVKQWRSFSFHVCGYHSFSSYICYIYAANPKSGGGAPPHPPLACCLRSLLGIFVGRRRANVPVRVREVIVHGKSCPNVQTVVTIRTPKQKLGTT